MKILAFDSSGLVASVAVVEDENLLAEYTVNYKKTHSQTLLPMLDEIASMLELKLCQLDGIAVAGGPGSFTGLRIGASTVKGLCLALDKPIIHVPTLEGLAYNLAGTDRLICPLMDARRNQVYAGAYRVGSQGLTAQLKERAQDIRELAAEINEAGEAVVFLGDGVPVYRELLEEQIRVPFTIAPPHLNKQKAGSVAALGLLYLKAGRGVYSAAAYQPAYLRLPQAERERRAREGKSHENP